MKYYFFKIILLSIIISLFSIYNLSSQALVINEIMSSNFSTIADEDGDYEDWIEIYNGTDSVINLAGYKISDDLYSLNKWTLPEVTLQPEEFLLIFASGKDKYEGEYLHTNFRISKDGEPIILSNYNQQIIDYFAPIQLKTDHSYGRQPDGSTNLVFFNGSTPGYSNNLQELYIEYSDELIFSHKQGFYEEEFYLNIFSSNNKSTIYFSIDGSDPDTTSLVFDSSIFIYNNKDKPNIISSIKTNTSDASHGYIWQPPKDNVFKATVIKAQSYLNGSPISDVYTKTFFVDDDILNRYNNLPIISISTDSINLFDYETGIYVPGKHNDNSSQCIAWWGCGNYYGTGIEWERPAYIEFFETDGNLAFAQNIGIRIHGNSSRALPQKSLRLYARNVYGNKYINHNIFPWKNVNNYKRILLRNSGNDFAYNMFVDALSSLVIDDLDIEKQDYRPAIVFLNGEFWGLHNIRDRIDKNFFEYTKNVPKNELDYLDYWTVPSMGNGYEFVELYDFIKYNDLSLDANYNYVENLIDIDNFIDYLIIRQYSAIYDWPGNNVNIWRHRGSGKWRWVFHDNDRSFHNYDFDAIEHSTLEDGSGWPNPPSSTLIIRKLLGNKKFLNKYLQNFEYHLENRFNEKNINHYIDSILSLIQPIMKEHINRWQYPSTYDEWKDNVNIIKEFAEKRPCYMLQHLITHFNITDPNFGIGICDNLVKDFDIDSKIVLYPNPANDIIHIDFRNTNLKIQKASIYDILGRKIKDIELTSYNHNNHLTIRLDNITQGNYILIVNTNQKTISKNFVVIK